MSHARPKGFMEREKMEDEMLRKLLLKKQRKELKDEEKQGDGLDFFTLESKDCFLCTRSDEDYHQRYQYFFLMGDKITQFFTIESGERVAHLCNVYAQYADLLFKEVDDGKLTLEVLNILCNMEFRRLFFDQETDRNKKIPESTADADEEYETVGFALNDFRPNSNRVLNFMIVRRKGECDGCGERDKKIEKDNKFKEEK